MQRVQTRIRRRLFPWRTETFWMLGSQRLRVRLWAWLMLFPVPGPFPQISHFFDMGSWSFFSHPIRGSGGGSAGFKGRPLRGRRLPCRSLTNIMKYCAGIKPPDFLEFPRFLNSTARGFFDPTSRQREEIPRPRFYGTGSAYRHPLGKGTGFICRIHESLACLFCS